MTVQPTIIELEVAGSPAGQPRQRYMGYIEKGTGKARARGYNPGTADDWKNRVYLAALARTRGLKPHNGPARIDWWVYFSRPKYLQGKSAPDGPIPHTAKPDRDNIDKGILDSLKSAGVLTDDCRVYSGEMTKLYVAKGKEPGARIRITLYPESRR